MARYARGMRALVAFVVAVMWLGSARAESEGIQILKTVLDKERDKPALEKALVEVDALLVKEPKQADAHYTRGWVLSKLGRADESVTSYDKAFALDKTLADAAYNAGVVLAAAGKKKDAAVRFEKAFAVDPKHVDAAYNAGQTYYDLKQFAKAAQRWEAAAKLAPDDFNAAKKVVQAYMALGKEKEAKAARERVFAIKKAAKDPALAKMKSYVFDQFDVGRYHIYVYEAFDTSGDLAYVYQFQVTLADKPIGSVNLETSAVIREQGIPFVLGMDKDGKHTTFSDKAWKAMPAYKLVKAEATKKIKASF